MRIGWRQRVAAVVLGLGLFGAGCSDDQQGQEQEDLEVTQQEGDELGNEELGGQGEENLFPEQEQGGVGGLDGLQNAAAQEAQGAGLEQGFDGNGSGGPGAGDPNFAPTVAEGGFIGGPAGLPAGVGLPEMGTKMHYVVESGDTLSGIAKKIFGTFDRYTELAEMTGIDNPERIYPGDVIYFQLTPETVAFATEYEARIREEVTVQPGDTLATIAERIYGNAEYWKSIWRENDGVQDPNNLEAGMILYYYPAGGGSVTAATETAENVKNWLANKVEFSEIVNG